MKYFSECEGINPFPSLVLPLGLNLAALGGPSNRRVFKWGNPADTEVGWPEGSLGKDREAGKSCGTWERG